MKVDKQDAKLQEKMALNAFFNSAGYKIFKTELDEQKNFSQGQVENLTKGKFVPMDELCRLNNVLGYNAGIDAVLTILQSMRDDLAEPAQKATK